MKRINLMILMDYNIKHLEMLYKKKTKLYLGLNEDTKKFYSRRSQKDLYPGCKNFSKLSFNIHLYLLRCLYGWSNVSLNDLLELLREALPLLNIEHP
jgi:hypothetical protein